MFIILHEWMSLTFAEGFSILAAIPSGIVTLLLLFNDRIILLISSTLASGKSNDFSVVIDLFTLNKYTRVRAITYYYLFHI